MTTIRAVLPLIVGPSFLTVVATTTPTHAGTSAGAWSNPDDAVHVTPQAGAAAAAKPLKLAGAAPPLSPFASHHCGLQNVTVPAAVVSPMTKMPPVGSAY